MDHIPQRDVGPSPSGKGKAMLMTQQQEAHARAMVSKMPREELEDKYLRTHEENIILKRHARKQEEKIKRMATKLIRLVNDRKRQVVESGRSVKRTTRDVTLEETIENQQDKIRKLEKENELLKQKVHVAHQQLQTQGRRHTPYNHIQSRINSGLDKRPVSAGMRSGMSMRSPTQDRATSIGSGPSRYGHSLLEEAREENRNMHNMIISLQEQLANMEAEHDMLQKELSLKNVAHEDDVLKFKEHLNSNQKTTLNENIELIRLQREIKEKSASFTSVEARYRELQDNHQNVRMNYDKVLHELDAIKSNLLEEENRNLNLQNQMKHGSSYQRTIVEMQQNIRDLENEVEILKDANERLTSKAFTAESDEKWHQLERRLRMQIAQLESVIHSDVKDKDDVLGKISNERNLNTRMQEEQRRSHEECMRLRSDNQDLRDRLRLLSSLDDAVDVVELEEALAVIRQRRHLAAERKRPDFLESLDDEHKDPEILYSELQVQHADTIQELEKTREMLLMQHKINKDYQIEVESVSNKMEEMKREYENKLEHFAQLLDARSARIKKLERQLHDVAYGTKQYKFQKDQEDEEMEEEDTTFDITRLERGENLLEINIAKVTLSRDALQAIDDREPSIFITFAFYDYELVSTPIIKSGSPRFDFTSQYIVKVDDLFLHHLQKDNTLIELHQAFGTEYKTIAACKLKLNQLLDKPQGKLHGTALVTGVTDGGNYGTLDFWVRLRVPMDQAIRLYKERTKALGYLAANSATTQKQLDSNDTMQRQDETFNQLEIQVISCNHVQARREGVQPNVYCVYKFYDFADHDTPIIPSSNNPHFDDRQLFPIQMSSDLDAYLKSEKLVIYVFDDSDPDIASYLGKATVDLIPLAHNKVIKAPFQLYRPDNSENGTVEISFRWKVSYNPPESILKIPVSESERKEKQEQMIPEKLITPKKTPITPQKSTRTSTPKLPKPTIQSTPKPDVSSPEPIAVTPVKSVSEEPIRTLPQPKARTLKRETISEPEKDHLEVPRERDVDFKGRKPEVISKEPKKKKQEEPDEETSFDSALDENEEDEEESIEEEIAEDLDDEATDADDIETDTDSVVVMQSPGATKNNFDTVRVSVNHLVLHPESWVWKDPDVQKLFVEYTFLGSVEETPVSLPKPAAANEEISYNFSKVVHVDNETNEEKRNRLTAMIIPQNEMESTIGFVVVSEPTDDDKECEELGTATVDLKKILSTQLDVIDADMDVVDGEEVVGRLNVTVEAITALNSVVQEIHQLIEKQPNE